MSEIKRQFSVRDQNGREVLTIKLILDRSQLFIGDEEFMLCRTATLNIIPEIVEQMKEIERS